MTTLIRPETHGTARCDALARLHHRLIAALAPFRGKDAGVDRFFAVVEERAALGANAADQPVAAD